MDVDEQEFIQGAFTFSATDFAAMAIINHSNIILVSAKMRLLVPMKVRNEMIFEVKVSHMITKKRTVILMDYINEIKIFTGEFAIIIFNRHLLKRSII
jgi:acyl-CoA thioesterase